MADTKLLDSIPLDSFEGVVEVNDEYSFYYFVGVIVLILLFLALGGWIVHKKLNPKPYYFFTLSDGKETAYLLTRLLQERGINAYDAKLESYKYKKDQSEFDKALFSEIISKLDVNYDIV